MSIHGRVLRRERCSVCDSKDNVAVYESGYKKCFGADCEFYSYPKDSLIRPSDIRISKSNRSPITMPTAIPVPVPTPVPAPTAPLSELVSLEYKALPSRKISLETCRFWGYQYGEYKGKKCHVAPYFRDGKVVAIKLRFQDKSFTIIGKGTNLPLYGSWLFGGGGKQLIITEGELDALSIGQIQGQKWPVVSVPSGAGGAVRAIKDNIIFIEQFESVVFMFDNDDPGRKAAVECAALITPGKAKIASLPLKDASEMLVAGRGRDLVNAFWNAPPYRPDGILSVDEMWAELTKEQTGGGIPIPFKGLDRMTQGLRQGELVTITAGSGIGKSTFMRQLAYHTAMRCGEKVGYIALEDAVRTTALGLLGLHLKKRLLPEFRDYENFPIDLQESLRVAFDAAVGPGYFHFYEHFGSIEIGNLLDRIRYMSIGCGCKYIFLDHLSIVVSGVLLDAKLDERSLIDHTMTRLRMLVEQLQIGLILASHLKRPAEGKGWESGREVPLNALRGSGAIEQLSDVVLSLERDMQVKESEITMRVLKNRPTGETGVAGLLSFNKDLGVFEEKL